MPGKSLSSLFRSATRTTAKTVPGEDATLKQFVSSLDASSPSTSTASETNRKRSVKLPKSPSRSKNSCSTSLRDLAIDRLKLNSASNSGNSTKDLSKEISSILLGGTSLDTAISSKFGTSDDKSLEIRWFSSMIHNNISLRRREVSRDRKQKWIFKSNQTHRFDRLVRKCAQKLGADATIQVFGKLGRETGVKEYNALIGLCIEKARKTQDEEVSLQQIYKAYQLFKLMREQGFQLEEESYGPFLICLIDMEMVEEFQYFCGVIQDENPKSLSRLAYYEMLLWIGVNNEVKIKELCDFAANDDDDKLNFKENYLLALCESNRKEELLLLLEVVDITRFSSMGHLENIFRSLGRHSLESFLEKFILALKSCDIEAENISNFIFNYAISVPNLAVEDAILEFKNLHGKLKVTPSPASYEKLIRHCCDLLKVHAALDIIDQMSETGLTLLIETFHSILHACEESCNYNLVHRIYSVICRNNLKPDTETFRSMISLSIKMKDFEGAYNMIKDLEKMNLIPTANMYNAIMAGYFREKNIHGGLMVLKDMEQADVKPDSQTFSYLIANCDCEEDIVRNYEELKQSGVQFTKHIFMSLINAYAACGQFEKAKQVVLDKGVPIKSLNEIKCVLVSALASHGQISDALNIYEEIKQAECNVVPKAIICLIEHLQSEGELGRLLQLLAEVNDPEYWIDGCCRVILYCVAHKHLSSTVDLLKQLKDKFCDDEVATEVLFDEVFCKIAETEPSDLQFGLDLLQAIKEELQVRPSRRSLDFLLSACVSAKDLNSSLLIWKEYHASGLPYNGLTFLRMYQALLASGDLKAATKMLNKIPKDDPHIRCVINACKTTYVQPASLKGKNTKKRIEKGEEMR
ncbi:pentatricopeptide repeat-containing protein At4g04790, mitochondrial-like [Actinidia eriantha]|uniref:pentatricopeptide repeat-containing protein At4g04790, mitochondrial-like n=1 Tax=Actinidia eriantha TaxID=165200 RepID=UPI0025895187|nr:pentatricopeptide repeat-containing protein At4g04790, mitochondrial-like [Actinidia eriantha]